MKYLLPLVLALLLTACGSNISATHASVLDGTYTSLDGKSSITFTPNGKVRWGAKEAKYAVEGNILKYQFDGGLPSAFVLNSDGSISFNGVEKFKKT